MLFEQIQLGGSEKNFGYLFGDDKSMQVAVVDPGANPHKFIDRVGELEANCVLCMATHSHYDHIMGVNEVTGAFHCPFAAHADVPGVTKALHDGDTFSIGSVPVRIVTCPGHCADSILIVIDEEKVLVGDELFIGGVGMTHNEAQARLHYDSLHKKLLTMPGHLEVYAGHDYGAKPFSTIGEQRETNPYLQQPDFDSFWHLRQNWKQYVREHNLKWG